MKKFSTLILVIVFLGTTLNGDSLSLSFFQNATDNIFQNAYSGKDQLAHLSFYADKDFSKISLFTEGNYSYLFENTTLSYYFQNIGMDYLYPINEKTALYFSLLGQGAFYRPEYDDFNYLSFNFLTALKSYISPASIFKANYVLEYKNYRYSLFDFLSHSLNISFDAYFQTRTTIKSEVSWGLKHYLHPYSTQETSQEAAMGRHGRRSYLFLPREQYEGQRIQVLSATGLIAQGLGSKVGLNITGMKQWIISGENPFTSVEEFYMVENPSYDQFSWAGHQWGALLTVLIPWDIELKMGYSIADREFYGIESMSLEGELLGITRKDKRKQFEAKLEKDFTRFSLFLSYVYMDNNSNDPFFDWKGNFFAAGIEWNFFFGERK